MPPAVQLLLGRIQDNRLEDAISLWSMDLVDLSVFRNVDVLLQGTVNISKVDASRYKLTASSQTHSNGDAITGPYEPVFMCIYKGDRANYGIQGARMVI